MSLITWPCQPQRSGCPWSRTGTAGAGAAGQSAALLRATPQRKSSNWPIKLNLDLDHAAPFCSRLWAGWPATPQCWGPKHSPAPYHWWCQATEQAKLELESVGLAATFERSHCRVGGDLAHKWL